MIRKLLWKEWHEQRWKAAFGCVILMAFTAIGLKTRLVPDEVIIALGIFIGAILAASQLALLLEMMVRPGAGLLMGAVSIGICLSVLLVSRLWGERLTFLRGRENLLVIWFHLIDATVTFIGVDFYGYAEQHVLPRGLIDIFGTASVMYLLKLVVLPIVLYLLDKYVEEEEMNVFMKMIIMVLGLAPATRNFLRIIIGA